MTASPHDIFNFIRFLDRATGTVVCGEMQLIQSRVYISVNAAAFDLANESRNLLVDMTELWWWSRHNIPPAFEMLDGKPIYIVFQLDPENETFRIDWKTLQKLKFDAENGEES